MNSLRDNRQYLLPSGLAVAIAGVLASPIVYAQEANITELDAIEVSADAAEPSGTAPSDGYTAEATVTGTKTTTNVVETPQSQRIRSRTRTRPTWAKFCVIQPAPEARPLVSSRAPRF